MVNNIIKTALLLIGLSALFLFIGYAVGGQTGLTIAFGFALLMNGISFWFSDKIVLRMYGAQPLDKNKFPKLYRTVQNLSEKMQIPMPKLWLVSSSVANAFATGRGPKHASVAVTTGILDTLNQDELRGVLAHELSHIKNRDVLISTIAATLATAISYLAYMSRYAAFWGSSHQQGRRSNNPLIFLLVGLFAPLAATLIQLGISRSREYEADASGAYITGEPLALADALEKLSTQAQQHAFNRDMRYAPARSLGIANTFSGNGLLSLFSTHPPMSERIKRLYRINETLTHAKDI